MQCENLESGKNSLLGVEEIVRLSISSPDAVFKEDRYKERGLRLSVYSRILALLIQQTAQGKVFAVDKETELALFEFRNYLRKFYDQTKDCFRYSMEFIQEAISHLLKPTSKLNTSKVTTFLNECQSNIETQGDDCKKLSFLRLLKTRKGINKISKKKNKWLALHCVILFLHRKVCHWFVLNTCNCCNDMILYLPLLPFLALSTSICFFMLRSIH